MRLNLGSGPKAPDGWISVDRSPALLLSRLPFLQFLLVRTGVIHQAQAVSWDRGVMRHDMRRLPYTNGSVDAVYSSHALEHVYLAEAKEVVREVYRVLGPGGIFRLALPDGDQMVRDFIKSSDSGDMMAGEAYNRRLLAHPEQRPSRSEQVRLIFGGHVHRWQPTRTQVRQILEGVGFVKVDEWTFLRGRLEGLAMVETRPQSFFFEAEKPC